MSRHHGLFILTAAAVTAGLAGSALASPPSGISASNTFKVPFNEKALVNHDRVKFQTKDPTDVLNQDMMFAPGAYSGWHYHPGLVLFTVKTGTVTAWTETCEQKTYGPGHPNGAVFVEAHDTPMQVTSAGGATAHVTLVVPRGAPTRIESPVPSCAR